MSAVWLADDVIKDQTLANLLANLNWSVYPNVVADQVFTLVLGQPGFTDLSDKGMQVGLEYCHYWFAMNFGNQPGIPTPPTPPRTQILLDNLEPSTDAHGGPMFILTCQSLEGSFESGDVIFFNAVAQTTTYVDPQTLSCPISSATGANAGTFPVLVKSGDGTISSASLNFVFT